MIYYDGCVFTNEECEEILKHAQEFKKSGLDIAIGEKDYGTSYLPNKRKSTQSAQTSKRGEFVFDKINEILKSFNYKIIEDELPFDVIKYEEGDFIWRHRDDKGNRLFSFVIQLNDENNYVGGDFRYWIKEEEHLMTRKRGHGMIFLAGVYHEVLPVISGTRHSFVSFLRSDQVVSLEPVRLI